MLAKDYGALAICNYRIDGELGSVLVYPKYIEIITGEGYEIESNFYTIKEKDKEVILSLFELETIE